MNDIESRLRDLRRATDRQVRPSPELLGRIESSTVKHSGWMWRRWPQALAVAALAAVIVAVALLQPSENEMRVASRPPTQAEFVLAMNERCDQYRRETEEVQVLFPTPAAFKLAAQNRLDALTRSLERVEFVGTPPEATGLLERVVDEAHSAQAAAREAIAAADANDTAAASSALAEAEAAIGRVGDLLASAGADRCRPPRAP